MHRNCENKCIANCMAGRKESKALRARFRAESTREGFWIYRWSQVSAGLGEPSFNPELHTHSVLFQEKTGRAYMLLVKGNQQQHEMGWKCKCFPIFKPETAKCIFAHVRVCEFRILWPSHPSSVEACGGMCLFVCERAAVAPLASFAHKCSLEWETSDVLQIKCIKCTFRQTTFCCGPPAEPPARVWVAKCTEYRSIRRTNFTHASVHCERKMGDARPYMCWRKCTFPNPCVCTFNRVFCGLHTSQKREGQ